MYEPTPTEILEEIRGRKSWSIPAKQGLYFFISSLIITFLSWYDIVELNLIVIFYSYSILYCAWLAFSAIYDQIATLRYENAKLREQQSLTNEHITGLLQDILDQVKPKTPSE